MVVVHPALDVPQAGIDSVETCVSDGEKERKSWVSYIHLYSIYARLLIFT